MPNCQCVRTCARYCANHNAFIILYSHHNHPEKIGVLVITKEETEAVRGQWVVEVVGGSAGLPPSSPGSASTLFLPHNGPLQKLEGICLDDPVGGPSGSSVPWLPFSHRPYPDCSGTALVQVAWIVTEGSEVIMQITMVTSHSNLLLPHPLSP